MSDGSSAELFSSSALGGVIYHVVDDAHGLGDRRRLEAHVAHSLQEIFCSNGPLELVKVELLNSLGILWHLIGRYQDGIRRRGGGLIL